MHSIITGLIVIGSISHQAHAFWPFTNNKILEEEINQTKLPNQNETTQEVGIPLNLISFFICTLCQQSPGAECEDPCGWLMNHRAEVHDVNHEKNNIRYYLEHLRYVCNTDDSDSADKVSIMQRTKHLFCFLSKSLCLCTKKDTPHCASRPTNICKKQIKKNKIKFAQDASFADKLALNYWYTKNVFDIAINPQDMTNIEQEDEQMARVNELIENIQHDMRKADPEICIHFIKSGETTLPKTYDEETKNATHAQIKQLIDRHYFVHVNEEAH